MKTIATVIAAALLLLAGEARAETLERIDKTFDLAPGGTLVVEVDFGSIDIATSPAAGIAVGVVRSVERADKADEEAYLKNHPVTFEAGKDKLAIRSKPLDKDPAILLGPKRQSAHYTIRVPERFDVELKTAGGAIAIRNLNGKAGAKTSGGALRFAAVRGPIDGGTSGGPVTVEQCEGKIVVRTSGGKIEARGGGGSFDCKTSGGPVTVGDFNGPAEVATSGGAIALDHIRGAVSGKTSGGAITLGLVAPVPGDVALSTSGGPVTVSAPATAAFALDAATSGGGASCELPIQVEGKKQPGRIAGAVNGGGPKVVLRSSGGSIRVISN